MEKDPRPGASLVKFTFEILIPRMWSVQEQQTCHIHQTEAGQCSQPHRTAEKNERTSTPLGYTSVQMQYSSQDLGLQIPGSGQAWCIREPGLPWAGAAQFLEPQTLESQRMQLCDSPAEQ